MGPGNTWFSFGYTPPLQPIEMLLFDHDSSSPLPPPPSPPPPLNFHHPISYACHLFPPIPSAPIKFEDVFPAPQPAAQEPAPALLATSLFGVPPRDLQIVPAADGGGAGACGSDSAEAYSSTGCNVAFASPHRSTPDSRKETPLSVNPLAAATGTPTRVCGEETTKAVATPAAGAGHRTSVYRGVTRHRWTGRYEAHLWDNTCRREGQKRKGRQVYLGGYEKEEKAARAYDLAALKYWGSAATTNFPISTYEREIEDMKCMTKQEFIASIRRSSSGFSRGASIYRGVTRHHQHGKWQARIGRVAGNKDLYLGTFATEEEAAEAYDVAAIKFRGLGAVTNFELSRYDIEAITNTDLPIGSSSKRSKHSIQVEDNQLAIGAHESQQMNIVPNSFLQNLLQLGSPIHDHCGLEEESDQDICSQNFLLAAATHQHEVAHIHNPRLEGSGILQLIDFSPSQ